MSWSCHWIHLGSYLCHLWSSSVQLGSCALDIPWLPVEATCRVLGVGRILDHMSLVISISWTVLVQMIMTVSSENVWGLLHLQSRLAQSCICYILFTKSSQEAASMQEEVSGAHDCLMGVATVSQCNWVRTQEEEWPRLFNLPHLKLVSAKEHDMPTKNPFKNPP